MEYEKLQIESLIDKAKFDMQKTLSIYSGVKILPLDSGLEDLLGHFDKGLRGELDPSYYLSSIDPGIGKTQAYCSFIRIWKEMGFIPESSILVAVHTKEEISSIVSRCGLEDDDFACLTADPAINGLGCREGNISCARVMFVTHAMLRSRTTGKLFSDAKEFHYLGAPRTLRIWDEAFLLAQPVTLSMHDLTRLSHSIRYTNPDLFAGIDMLVTSMMCGGADDCIVVPSEIGSHARAAKGSKPLSDTDEKTRANLVSVAGTAMVLRSVGGLLGRVLVGASAPLPADVAPAIILDASGRVRGTYKAQKTGSGKLVRLTPSVRDYGNVRVHVCKTKAGKTGLADDAYREQLCRASAKVIDSKPDEEWLVISYKSDKVFDIESDIKGYVANPGNVRFLNWGRHHGNNEFRDCKNILIIGSYLYGLEGYHALEIAASGLPADKFDGPSNEFAADELRHNLLQAIMRGNARNGMSGVAGSCEVYLFSSRTPCSIAAVKSALPNCEVQEWNVLDRRLIGSARNVFEYVKAHFSVFGAGPLAKVEVRKAVGIKQAPGLSKIINKPLFIDNLARIGVKTTRNTFNRAP